MRAVFDEIACTAQTDATVLITGESGTGKELVAEAIHRNSRRKDGPFLAVNMAALPETLVESELFGYVEGAFTGAASPRAGRFEAAHGGTLFIDEVGDLKLTSQAKLLRVLENHTITPVGGNENRPVDVRVIAASNHDLERMVAEGRFREDLYYRLNVVTIALPPLRARREDIPLLVEHFLDEICRLNAKPRLQTKPELLQFLESYDWPGNVRQLRNCIESMVILSRDATLGLDDLPALIRNARRGQFSRFEMPEGVTLADIVKAVVLQTLDRLDGNRTQAAQSLGISVRTLQRKLKQWQLGGEQAQSSRNEEFQPLSTS
jgi:transcriptional regulator with PAS, ATPase and Fis domain